MTKGGLSPECKIGLTFLKKKVIHCINRIKDKKHTII